MEVLKLHHADLSTETLRMIRNDLDKYSHLKLYKPTHDFLGEVIKARRIEADQARRKSAKTS